MDTEIIILPASSRISQYFVSHAIEASGICETAIAKAPALVQQDVDTARIAVADYLRANGLYDPDKVARISREVVEDARQRSASPDSSLVTAEAIKAATSMFGIDGQVPEATAGTAARAAAPCVPPPMPRRMIRQPLGELPELPGITQADVWRRCVRQLETVLQAPPQGGADGTSVRTGH